MAHSTGSAFNNELWTTWSAGDWQDVVLGDFDGDGRMDIAGRLNGQWWATRLVASRATGTPISFAFNTLFIGGWSTGVTWQDVTVGDFNGDNIDDIAGRAGGQWWVGRSNGRSLTNQLWGGWSTGVTWNNVTSGDFDGDGRTDIAGRAGGQWWVARSTGGAFTNQLWGGWADVAWRDVHAAAFTFNPSQSETAAPTSNAADNDIALAAALTTSNPQKDSKTALAAVFADWNEELPLETSE